MSERLSELQYNPIIAENMDLEVEKNKNKKKEEILDLIHDLKDVIRYIEVDKKKKKIKKKKEDIHAVKNKIIKLIEYGEYMLTRDAKISSNIYSRIYYLYNFLSEEEKEDLYLKIINFYKSIKKFLAL